MSIKFKKLQVVTLVVTEIMYLWFVRTNNIINAHYSTTNNVRWGQFIGIFALFWSYFHYSWMARSLSFFLYIETEIILIEMNFKHLIEAPGL